MNTQRLKLIVSVAALLVGHALPGHTATAAAKTNDLSGVWWIENYEPHLLPQNGKPIPFTPAGQAQYQKNLAGLASGELSDGAVARCLPEGLPRSVNSAFPMQILQREKFVAVINEANHVFWFIALNGKRTPVDDLDPTFMGENLGQWQGDTLVVDSMGFKASSFIDSTGLPLSEQLHVVQRLKKLSSKQLEDIITIEDPVNYTAPWTVRRTYELRPDVQIMEYTCDEPHRALTGSRAKAVRLNWKAPK